LFDEYNKKINKRVYILKNPNDWTDEYYTATKEWDKVIFEKDESLSTEIKTQRLALEKRLESIKESYEAELETQKKIKIICLNIIQKIKKNYSIILTRI
jgi:hypothetical protein